MPDFPLCQTSLKKQRIYFSGVDDDSKSDIKMAIELIRDYSIIKNIMNSDLLNSVFHFRKQTIIFLTCLRSP
jgi:hypothetical protein